MKEKRCPQCNADISDSWEDYDPSVGIMSAGWYCDVCNLPVECEPDELEPDLNARSFRETYIEAWHEHQRLHRR